eukprot:m.225161 g.225161  ORF g.225161 m.225161 type:complete len:62 (+) comp40009_c0_seq2:589-774(+)
MEQELVNVIEATTPEERSQVIKKLEKKSELKAADGGYSFYLPMLTILSFFHSLFRRLCYMN